jgi:demethylmenaquinone methyltransferase/2-methoxy-6-polyprenyl-1,4-benzoquinol methylase
VSQALQALTEACVVADESDKMLAFAAQKPGLLPTRTAAEHLPYPDDTFDYIIMIDALHHVADQQATANELWRVCKPGGRIVIEEPDLRRFMVKLVSLGEKLMLMRTKIIMPEAIQALFPKSSQVVKDNFAVWVVVNK